jgi:hypothetical protein
VSRESVDGLLADTWWYGLTSRLSARDFARCAVLRAEQGFNAVQLVVGIPPEVGPASPHAASEVGVAWSSDGAFNDAYVALAQERIRLLNAHGLRAVVYGAWGHQIGWLGRQRMADWWGLLVRRLDDLDVVYCLTGELTLWIGREGLLLPDRSTDDVADASPGRALLGRLPAPVRRRLRAAAARDPRHRRQLQGRKADWTFVLERLAATTDRAIIVHPTTGTTGRGSVLRPELLAAETVQTGHSAAARTSLWELPLQAHEGFVNLEPWYEGIHNGFGCNDQLYAYWVSVLAGATGHCYGAHGMWNVGDGRFLAHWGGQTFAEAVALETPRLLGRSNALWREWGARGEPVHSTRGGALTMIGRRDGDRSLLFFPDAARPTALPAGRYWIPTTGRFADQRPPLGSVVVVTG